MSKRKYQSDDQREAYKPEIHCISHWMVDDGGKDGHLVLHLHHAVDLSKADLQELTGGKPSSSGATWDKVAPALGLKRDLNILQLDTFTIPNAILPPSFHRELMKNGSRWLDVYQEPWNCGLEESRLRLLEAWFVPVCSLFCGRLVDTPEASTPETPETSPNEIEHKIFMLDNCVLVVIEMNPTPQNTFDDYAQVLLELVSTMKLNPDTDFDRQPPIYAMLSDLRDYNILSYDGKEFRRMARVTVSLDARADFLRGMAHVSNLLFSVLLNGYIEMLAAVEKLSAKRSEANDVSKHRSISPGIPVIGEGSEQSSRPSLGLYSKAHLKALEAQKIMVGADLTSEDTWDQDGRRGINLLNESFKDISKFGSLADWDERNLKH